MATTKITEKTTAAQLRADTYFLVTQTESGVHSLRRVAKDVVFAGIEGDLAAAYDSTADYAVGRYCIHDGGLYRCKTPITGGETWTAAHWDAVTVGEVLETISAGLETKAEIDGLYEDMTVGNAEQLVSTIMVEDQDPYNFRTAGGSADIGNRAYDALVGGTLVWNQMVRNGNFISGSGWSAYTGSELSFSDGVVTVHKDEGEEVVAGFNLSSLYYLPLVNGHKYLLMATVQTTNGMLSFRPTDNYLDGTTGYAEYSSKTKMAWMWECPADDLSFICRFLGYTGSGVTGSVDFTVENVIFFDLTRMFGADIADHVYSLEQATPGAGAAWFRKLFPKDYYAYDTGSLQSVQAASHEMVGFNAYDHSTGKAVLLGGNQYQITGAYTALAYEDSGGGSETITPDANGLFTPVSSGTLTVTGGDGTTTCVHLVWSGYRNGEYEPYVKRSYALDDALTLRGIPKLDAANNLYYDGDAYESNGTVTRKYGIVDLGTLDWTYASNYGYFAANAPTDALKPTRAEGLSTILTAQYLTGNVINSNSAMADVPDKSILYYITSSNFKVFIKDLDYTDAATLTTALSGVYMQYPLNAPATETADPFQSPQIVDDFGTEKYVDAGVTASTPTRDVAIPVGHVTRYPANLRDKLQHLPDLADSDGQYVITQDGSQMTLTEDTSPGRLTALEAMLPDAPTTDGTYSLQVTVADGEASYSWASTT